VKTEVVVVGAGPAGLAVAIQLARRQLDVVVCEQQTGPPDKACGEGVMPAGRRQLESLDVIRRLAPADHHALAGIRYIQEDGSSATGNLPPPGGLGIRRTALTRALADAAAEAGVRLLWGCRVEHHDCTREAVRLQTGRGPLTAQLLVAADGLHSPVRRRAGLGVTPPRRRRFGLRRHYRLRPWSNLVEVHLAEAVEAFVTPVGAQRLGVAFLFDPESWSSPGDEPLFDRLLACFPLLAERLTEATVETPVRGAGPLAQPVAGVVARRLVLLGDAAGYLDAITGEGLSLALASAAELARITPRALQLGADRAALAPYARAHARIYRRYELVTRAVLGLARRPRLRRPLLRWLGRNPRLLDRLISWALE